MRDIEQDLKTNEDVLYFLEINHRASDENIQRVNDVEIVSSHSPLIHCFSDEKKQKTSSLSQKKIRLKLNESLLKSITLNYPPEDVSNNIILREIDMAYRMSKLDEETAYRLLFKEIDNVIGRNKCAFKLFEEGILTIDDLDRNFIANGTRNRTTIYQLMKYDLCEETCKDKLIEWVDSGYISNEDYSDLLLHSRGLK